MDTARLPLLPPEPAGVDAWIAQAEDNSPEVRALQARVDAAQAEIDKAKGGHYPTLDAVGVSRSAGENVNSPRSRNTNHMLGFQLTVPLFRWGYTQSTVRQGAGRAGARPRKLWKPPAVTWLCVLHQEFRGVSEGVLKVRAL